MGEGSLDVVAEGLWIGDRCRVGEDADVERPFIDSAVMLAPVPATGPIGIVASTSAPDTKIGNGAPRRFDVAKSMRAAWRCAPSR